MKKQNKINNTIPPKSDAEQELERQLEQEIARHIKESPTPPNPGVCQWCDGKFGCQATKEELRYWTTLHYQGWYSHECAYLMHCATEACDRDDKEYPIDPNKNDFKWLEPDWK